MYRGSTNKGVPYLWGTCLYTHKKQRSIFLFYNLIAQFSLSHPALYNAICTFTYIKIYNKLDIKRIEACDQHNSRLGCLDPFRENACFFLECLDVMWVVGVHLLGNMYCKQPDKKLICTFNFKIVYNEIMLEI